MPIPVLRLRTVLLASCVATLLLPASAVAQRGTIPAEVRVVTADGRTLTEHVQHTGTVQIRTRPRANCFGPGTGGSGERYRLPGPTALGLVFHGARGQPALRPIRVTDAFYESFGSLGVCAIGGHDAPRFDPPRSSGGFWYLKVNRAAAQAGGDQTRVRRGDRVLWYLIEDSSEPNPQELVLRSRTRARPGNPFGVRVLAFDDGGNPSPAAGARVRGADRPTGPNGWTTVTPERRGVMRLQAQRAGDIPSNRVRVCVRARINDCPPGHWRRIVGTSRRDVIRTGRGSNVIQAFGGDDRIDLRRSRGRNRVQCGPGENTVVARPGQRFQHRNCDRIVRKRRG